MAKRPAKKTKPQTATQRQEVMDELASLINETFNGSAEESAALSDAEYTRFVLLVLDPKNAEGQRFWSSRANLSRADVVKVMKRVVEENERLMESKVQ